MIPLELLVSGGDEAFRLQIFPIKSKLILANNLFCFRSYLRSPSGGGVICFNVFFAFVVLFCSALCISLEKEEMMRISSKNFIDEKQAKQSRERFEQLSPTDHHHQFSRLINPEQQRPDSQHQGVLHHYRMTCNRIGNG